MKYVCNFAAIISIPYKTCKRFGMKKLYIISMCAMLCAGPAFAAPHFKTKRGTARKSILKTEASAALWRPSSQTEYFYEDGEWIDAGTSTFTYDSRGNAVEERMDDEDGFYRVSTEYNENNRPVSIVATYSEDGETWQNESKRTYVYDPIVTGYFTERMGYDWEEDTWVKNYYCETNVITRDAGGNIIEIVKSLPFGEEMYPAYKAVWNYDLATGKANEFLYYQNTNFGEPVWELYDGVSYGNIVWENTDGQMTGSELSAFMTGANRIKSCEVMYEGETDGHVFVEYTEGKPNDYFVKETYVDPTIVGVTESYETIDDNGSFRVSICEYFDEDGNPTEEPVYSVVTTVTNDEHGNAVKQVDEMTYEGETESAESYADYTYDANGNVMEVVMSYYDEELDEKVPESKTVFGEYVDASAGVANIAVETAAGFKVYNLQGMPVNVGGAKDLNTLPAGLYIVNGKKQLIRK